MNELQSKLLEIFKWLVKFLDDNHIRYYMIGGTMLGAIRHKGFIPWDDDVDIAVPRSDFNKIIELFKDGPIDHYVFEYPSNDDPEFLYPFGKVYDANTTMIEHLKKDVVRGVYIDIFPLDGIGNTLEEAQKNYKKLDRKNMLLAMKISRARKGRKWWKNVATYVGSLIPVNRKKLIKSIDKLCTSRDFDKYNYVGNLVSTYRAREIMERSIFGKPTTYEFEGVIATGPEKYDEYLSTLFRNWRELPPEDKRVSAHDFIYLDLNKSWKEYKKNEK